MGRGECGKAEGAAQGVGQPRVWRSGVNFFLPTERVGRKPGQAHNTSDHVLKQPASGKASRGQLSSLSDTKPGSLLLCTLPRRAAFCSVSAPDARLASALRGAHGAGAGLPAPGRAGRPWRGPQRALHMQATRLGGSRRASAMGCSGRRAAAGGGGGVLGL